MGLSAIWLLIIIITILKDIRNPFIDLGFYYSFMTLLLLVGGTVLSSLMFHETSEISKGYLMAILPVSIVEKLFSAWFVSTILYGLAMVVLYYLGLTVFTLLQPIGLNFKDLSYHFIPNEAIQAYVLANAFCLMGASWFKKNPIVMNMVFSTVTTTLFFVGIAVMYYFIRPFGLFESVSTTDGTALIINDNITQINIEDTATSMVLITLLSGFFMLVAFFKLKERNI